VPERVRQAVARPVVNHRGPEFRATLAHAEALIQPVLGTSNRVLLFAASGTGMMEAALVNTVAPGERLLIVCQGQFGERFASIARVLRADVDTFDVPWGEAVDPAALALCAAQQDYRAIVLIHNESSTGVATDLGAVGAALRGNSALLIVDSVSGLGGIEMRQDEWGVDIVVSASQKALMCPPGLGLASVSGKAWQVINRPDRTPSFYWSFAKALAAMEKSETAFTAPVNLVFGLCEALDMIHEEGLAHVLARHARLSAALRAGGAALGLSSFGSSSNASNTVVAFTVPEGLDGGKIVRALYEDHGSVIAGSRNRLSGRVIRIGTMGSLNEGTILTDLSHLAAALAGMGHRTTTGAGLMAASAALHTGN
jgi:aspartate aminotransferase-like enzyme